MNRYPSWKYAIMVVVLLIAALYTLPNFFGEAPAVQVSSSKAIVKVDQATLAKVEQTLKTRATTIVRSGRWRPWSAIASRTWCRRPVRHPQHR